jgi:hypothetical protein
MKHLIPAVGIYAEYLCSVQEIHCCCHS